MRRGFKYAKPKEERTKAIHTSVMNNTSATRIPAKKQPEIRKSLTCEFKIITKSHPISVCHKKDKEI